MRRPLVSRRWHRHFGRIVRSGVIGLLALTLTSGATMARVCEGPGINHRPSFPASDDVLSVLAFNVFLLPSHVRNVPVLGENFALGQEERAERIPPFLEPYDVVILSEAYDDGARALLLEGLRSSGFSHITPVLGTACRAAESCDRGTVYDQQLMNGDDERGGEGDTWFSEDGGVLIASKYPISAAKEMIYPDCAGSDCNAAKGFVYAAIEKGSARYHVIGTHAQFGWGADQRMAKQAQIRAILHFIENGSGIPRSEPIIVGGDFNILRHELEELLKAETLGAIAPSFLGYRYTRESRNDWARRGNGYVDYVLAKDAWRAPHYSSNCPMVFRTRYDFEDRTLLSVVRGKDYCDLSDHYAVWGFFDYREGDAAPPDCPMPEFPAG
jgi:endonuclease/exonuclease/phosphatase family metal-dependent hydrolase